MGTFYGWGCGRCLCAAIGKLSSIGLAADLAAAIRSDYTDTISITAQSSIFPVDISGAFFCIHFFKGFIIHFFLRGCFYGRLIIIISDIAWVIGFFAQKR
jgi:hypothetical protein